MQKDKKSRIFAVTYNLFRWLPIKKFKIRTYYSNDPTSVEINGDVLSTESGFNLSGFLPSIFEEKYVTAGGMLGNQFLLRPPIWTQILQEDR